MAANLPADADPHVQELPHFLQGAHLNHFSDPGLTNCLHGRYVRPEKP